MKFGPVTKPYKESKTESKRVDNDFMSVNRDVIIIFQIYDQFGAIRKPDSRDTVCETFIFINSNYLKTAENRTIKSLTQLSHYCFK